jgi:hypothetical protein
MRSIKNNKEMSKGLSKFVHSIRQEAISMDKDAFADGKLIKYIFEIRNSKGLNLAFLYSDVYLSNSEALNRANVKIKKKDEIIIRGPFPLYDGALANSKIARWEKEKERSVRDSNIIKEETKNAKESGFKYIYFLISNEYNVDRVLDFEISEKALVKSAVNKMLAKLPSKGRVERINLVNNKANYYENSIPS